MNLDLIEQELDRLENERRWLTTRVNVIEYAMIFAMTCTIVLIVLVFVLT